MRHTFKSDQPQTRDQTCPPSLLRLEDSGVKWRQSTEEKPKKHLEKQEVQQLRGRLSRSEDEQKRQREEVDNNRYMLSTIVCSQLTMKGRRVEINA